MTEMNLEKLLSLDGEHNISAEEAQSLNEDLAKISAIDIPIIHRVQIVDYLINALNANSVENEIRPALDLLLSELQMPA